MKFVKINSTCASTALFGVVVMTSMAGCASVGKTFAEINPEQAKIEVQSNNGYLELKDVPAGAAKVIIRSEGQPMAVKILINHSDDSCQPFQPVGTVA